MTEALYGAHEFRPCQFLESRTGCPILDGETKCHEVVGSGSLCLALQTDPIHVAPATS